MSAAQPKCETFVKLQIAINRTPQRFYFVAQILRHFGTTCSRITHALANFTDAILRLICPLIKAFPGIFVAAPQVLA